VNLWRLVIVLFVGVSLIGCQYKVPLMNTPVDVSGKLTKGGQALGNVTLMLQPLETGHPVPLAVGNDGSFKGTIIPGKYAYFLVAKEDGSSNLNGVDKSLMEANMTRTVKIEPGQTQLDVSL